MIAAIIDNCSAAQALIETTFLFAHRFDKQVAFVALAQGQPNPTGLEKQITCRQPEGFNQQLHFYELDKLTGIPGFCEEKEVSFLLIQQSDNKRKHIQASLNACRELRIPYLLHKNSFAVPDLARILVPVSFLEEEVEKAQFASAFGRFMHSEIHLLQANDYGSKASKNTERINGLLDKFQLSVQVTKAKGDSFKVNREAVKAATEHRVSLLLVTASREYGLDDLLFGPMELHVVQKSDIPVLLINPRSDLYALCD